MASIDELKGYCYPLTPEGKASLLGDMPWHYGTEYLNIAYKADAEAIAKWIPQPLEPGPEPDRAYVAFSKWWSVWDSAKDMTHVNPERTQYTEAAIWVGCSYKGQPGQMCLSIWVDNDFTMARGWFMGFPKKLGQISITSLNGLNPGMKAEGEGSVMSGIVSSHGERLIKGTATLERKITREQLPKPMGLPIFHVRHFPSLVAGAKPSVMEIVKLGAKDWHWDPVVWEGKGALDFLPSELEEHMPLKPKEIIGAYRFRNGYTFDGAEVVHDYLK